MLFNSYEFAIFFSVLLMLYWIATKKNLKIQNTLLLVASYFFYGWWDWRFLFLLVSLSLLNFLIGIEIEKNEHCRRRRFYFIIGLFTNLGVLGVFKYYNFFIDGFIHLLAVFGYNLPRSSTKIILPLGISFYVFLSLSYIIDIYKKSIKADNKIIEVLLTLSFFPIILAGPIQRPSTLLPQISKKREFNYCQAIDGIKQILWGLFAKVVIADNLTSFVDVFFSNYSHYQGSTLALGALFFTIQIYADFSGYSNIATGVAKLLGFSLMQNFAYPYFSRDIIQFWKRWHISLTTWFRDYIFLPLSFLLSSNIGGSTVLRIKTEVIIYILSSIVVWFLTGLWHGANYTYIFWGIIQGLFLVIYRIQIKPRKKWLRRIRINNNNVIVIFVDTISTSFIVVTAWVFFRADSIKDAVSYLDGVFSKSLFTIPYFAGRSDALIMILLVIYFIVVEWFGREQPFAIARMGTKWGRVLRYAIYYSMIIIMILFGAQGHHFIYFQF